MAKLNAVTPSELLLKEFLEPMGLSQCRLTKGIGVPPQRIGEIVAGNRAVTNGHRSSAVPLLWSVQRLLASGAGGARYGSGGGGIGGYFGKIRPWCQSRLVIDFRDRIVSHPGRADGGSEGLFGQGRAIGK